MRIRKEQTVALAVDIQERLFPHIDGFQTLEQETIKLINGFQALDVPLLVTEQYTKGLGPTIPSIVEALDDQYKPVEKLTFSCCGVEQIMTDLRSLDRPNVVLFGIETHVCVMQTALDLLELQFKPVIVSDAVSSRKKNDRSMAIERLRKHGATITTVESLLFELCVKAGTDTFKTISKLVK